MIQESKMLGCLAQFALAGTVQATPSAGTVSGSFIPDNAGADATPNPLWMPLGIIQSVQEKVSSTKNDIYRPSPGTLQLANVLESKFKRSLMIKVSECSNAMWLITRRAFLTSSARTGAIGTHNPLSGGTVRGWLKAQSYNQDTNTQELAEQIWGVFTIDSVNYGDDKVVEFSLDVTQLWSSLNTATGA